eukprot:362069-Chlamydomonas_euryale.AAC.1
MYGIRRTGRSAGALWYWGGQVFCGRGGWDQQDKVWLCEEILKLMRTDCHVESVETVRLGMASLRFLGRKPVLSDEQVAACPCPCAAGTGGCRARAAATCSASTRGALRRRGRPTQATRS